MKKLILLASIIIITNGYLFAQNDGEVDAKNGNLHSKELRLINSSFSNEGGLFFVPNDSNKNIVKVGLCLVTGKQAERSVFSGSSGGQKSYEKTIQGKKSQVQLNEVKPTFFFNFPENQNPNQDNWWFAFLKEPKDFAIIKLDKKKDTRFFFAGIDIHIGGWGSAKSGIVKNDKLDFEYKMVKNGLYSVTFNQPLDYGEYCFIYVGTVSSKYINNKVLDFGIFK